jgi:topoisomerase IA-like protein
MEKTSATRQKQKLKRQQQRSCDKGPNTLYLPINNRMFVLNYFPATNEITPTQRQEQMTNDRACATTSSRAVSPQQAHPIGLENGRFGPTLQSTKETTVRLQCIHTNSQ